MSEEKQSSMVEQKRKIALIYSVSLCHMILVAHTKTEKQIKLDTKRKTKETVQAGTKASY